MAYHLAEYSTFSSDIDLEAALASAIPDAYYRAARIGHVKSIKIITVGSGALALQSAADGNPTITLTGLTAGETISIPAKKILSSGTSISKCRVEW